MPTNIPTELHTIRDFLRYATSRFNEAGLHYGHGTDNAWDEAASLILHTLHLPHSIHPAALEAALVEAERHALMALIEKRISSRIPAAYLIHEAWFADLPFYVDERVLIPRSPMAELIENRFEPWVDPNNVNLILDLCTGSGCIAVACAKAFPDAIVDAVDISQDALAVAKINVLKHILEDRLHLHQADVFQGLPNQQYDIIISNPPYVGKAEMLLLPPEYRHEPSLGLKAGETGLEIIQRILSDASAYLKPHGILIVEVGNQTELMEDAFPGLPFTWLTFARGEDGVFLLHANELPAN